MIRYQISNASNNHQGDMSYCMKMRAKVAVFSATGLCFRLWPEILNVSMSRVPFII